MIDFGRLVQPMELRVQFQAGFVGEELSVLFLNDKKEWQDLCEIEADDDHDMQNYVFSEEGATIPTTSAIKVVFSECTDFYGRVTIYQIQVWGKEQNDVPGGDEPKSGVESQSTAKR